jgi:hypothetical protein
MDDIGQELPTAVRQSFRRISSARAHLGSSAIPTSKTTRFVVRQWSGAHDIRRLAIRFRKLLIYKEMTSWAARSALVEGSEERLPRRGDDCRGGTAPNDEVRGDEDVRTARSTASLCRVKLDPNALIKERYVGMSTAKLIQSRWRLNGNIAIRHLEYRAEKWRSVTLDCHSNFHHRTPLLSV